jgi:hypothetical protein
MRPSRGTSLPDRFRARRGSFLAKAQVAGSCLACIPVPSIILQPLRSFPCPACPGMRVKDILRCAGDESRAHFEGTFRLLHVRIAFRHEGAVKRGWMKHREECLGVSATARTVPCGKGLRLG